MPLTLRIILGRAEAHHTGAGRWAFLDSGFRRNDEMPLS